MQRQKKWPIYLMLVLIMLSVCMLVPFREDEARHGAVVSAEAKLMKPESVISVDYKIPEDETENVLFRTQGNIAVKDGSLQMMRCFWAVVLAVLLLLCCIFESVGARYRGYIATLRYHIFYIHQLDGKKKTAFCNKKNGMNR